MEALFHPCYGWWLTACNPRAVRNLPDRLHPPPALIHLPVYITLLCVVNKQSCSSCCPAHFSSFHSGDPDVRLYLLTVHTHSHTSHAGPQKLHSFTLTRCPNSWPGTHCHTQSKLRVVVVVEFIVCIVCRPRATTFYLFSTSFTLKLAKIKQFFKFCWKERRGSSCCSAQNIFQIFS